MEKTEQNTNEEPIQCAMSEDQPDLSVVEVEEEAPAIKKLLGQYAEVPIRAFLLANMKDSFTEPDRIDIYLVDDARIVAEYMSDAGRLYQADFLFYESSQPRIGGMMVKESHKEKFWVMQATTTWATHWHKQITEEVERRQQQELQS